mgnify:FL=1
MSELPKGWVETTLGEVAIIKGGKRLPKGETLITSRTKHPYIRITDLDNNAINKNQLQFVTDEVFSRISRYIVNSGDVIVSIVGTIGLVAKIDDDLDAASLTENCVKFINLKNLTADYLYYYLISRRGQYEINKNTVGAVQKKLPIYGVQNIEINLPPFDEQKSIADILIGFDDKIELLHEQNKTLEALAQTLFKEWFVKFNFPNATGEMINSELGQIPKGWRVGKLGEIAIVKSGYAFKGKDFVDQSNSYALKIKDLKGNGKIDLSDTSNIKDLITSSDRVQYFKLSAGDIVFAMSGNTTGKIGLIPEFSHDLYLNQRVGKFFVNKPKYVNFLYTFLMSNDYEEKILNMGYGSAQPNVNPGQIENIDIVLPDSVVFNSFVDIINPIYKKIKNNTTQIQSLEKTRDVLLPKLMSGNIRA